MFSLNRAQLIGNLTRDPEVRTLPSGQSVCSISVATNRRWKDKEGNTKEDTQYHEITIWGKLGELASSMLAKGKKVYVEGRLQTSSWEGTDGAKRSKTEIVADSFIPLSPKSGYESAGVDSSEESQPASKKESKPAAKKDEPSDSGEINLEDIPF